jgi:hypothetical protein
VYATSFDRWIAAPNTPIYIANAINANHELAHEESADKVCMVGLAILTAVTAGVAAATTALLRRR